MRDAEGRTVRELHRVRGRAALQKRATGLLLAVHRYARARAVTVDDQAWAARWIDGLTSLLGTGGRP